MIQVTFTTLERHPGTKRWSSCLSRSCSPMATRCAERIARADGAERWAHLLPFGYRSGDLHSKVTEVAATEPVDASFRYSTAA